MFIKLVNISQELAVLPYPHTTTNANVQSTSKDDERNQAAEVSLLPLQIVVSLSMTIVPCLEKE